MNNINQKLTELGIEELKTKLHDIVSRFEAMGYLNKNTRWVPEHVEKMLCVGETFGMCCRTDAVRMINNDFEEYILTVGENKRDRLLKYIEKYAGKKISKAIKWLNLIEILMDNNEDYPHDDLMTDLKYVVMGTMHYDLNRMKILPTTKTVDNIKIRVPQEMIEIHYTAKELKAMQK